MDTHFAEQLDRAVAEERYVDRARSLLEREFSTTGRPRRRVSRIAVVGLVGAAAAAAVLLLMLSPRDLSVTLQGVSGNLEEGTWVSAAVTPRRLIFSDGSTVVARQNTELRVLSLRADGADLLLENGEFEADIVHAEKTRWSFRAGPYKVRVIGTAFKAAWNPDQKDFRLQMLKGSVHVSGPLLDKGKTLLAGNDMEVSLLRNAVAIHRGDLTETISSNRSVPVDDSPMMEEVTQVNNSAPAKGVETQILPTESRSSTSASRSAGSVKTPQSASEDWKAAARSGDYSGAMAIVDQIGFNSVVSSASVEELMFLADAARLAANPTRAEQVYTLVRSRFPLTEQSQRAAFTVGRMYFNRGAHSRAAEWFRLCINDNRAGTMTREAAGRLIEALDNAGDRPGALGAATKYLQVFPDGPHARLAEKIVARSRIE